MDGESYLRKLVRYIHLNPIRVGLTDNPLKYRWCSHQAYLMQNEFTWLARDAGLQMFGESRQDAMDACHRFVLSGIGQDDGFDFKTGIKAGMIGDELFIERMRGRNGSVNEDKSQNINLTTLLSAIADWYGIELTTLPKVEGERKIAQIRATTTLLARHLCKEVSIKEIAHFFSTTDNSLSQAATRLEIRMGASENRRSEINELKQRLLQNCEV